MPGKRSVYFKREESRSKEPSLLTQPFKSRAEKTNKSKNTLSKNTGSRSTVSKGTTASNTTATKTPISKGTLTKTPISKGTATNTPTSRGTLTKTPISKSTVTKTPISKDTVTKTPKSTTPGTRSIPRDNKQKEVEVKNLGGKKYPWEDAKYDKFRESEEKDEDDDLGDKEDEEEPKIRLCFVDKREKDSNEKELVEIPSDEIGRFDTNIENLYYFHGFLAREEAEALLDKDGDFLIRECELDQRCHYVISAQYKDQLHHILVKTTRTKKLYWTYKYAFRSVVDLAIYHSRNGVAVYKDVVIVRGVGKQGWQINHEQIKELGKLGEGAFGQVHKGILKTHVMKNGIVVAVKKLTQQQLSGQQKQEFLKEARTMLPLRHPNVARLYGVCAMRHPMMLILEYCDKGSLITILLKEPTKLSMTQKIIYLYHAACGLEYIHEKEVIHRDLAARNCLVTAQNVVKISDFGMSHKGTSITELKEGTTPIRYMAPEAIKPGTFSSASDMFSYTALMYEVLHDGKEPYAEVKMPFKKFMKELRLFNLELEFKPPLDTPTFIYNIYDDCRVRNPEMRLTATEVKYILETQGECQPIKEATFMQRMREKCRNMFKDFHL